MVFNAVNGRLKVLKQDWQTSFIVQMTSMMVALKLPVLEVFECKWQYIAIVYCLSIITEWILCTIVGHLITVSISLRLTLRWASMEYQQFTLSPIQRSKSCIVASIWRKCTGHLDRYNSKGHTHPRNEHQWSVNNFLSCILDNHWPVQWLLPIITVLAAFMNKNSGDDITTTP
jgi:hypothetical protein